MKIVSVLSEIGEEISIINYGFESISGDAHWGKGRRDMRILHFVTSGEGYFNSTRVRTGEGFIIHPNEMHEYHSSKDLPWSYFYVIYSGEKSADLVTKYVKYDENGIFSFDLDAISDLKERILTEGGVISGAEAVGYFYLLLASFDKTKSLSSNEYVREAKRFMRANLYRPFEISEVARVIGISDRYLYNLFIKHEGCSVKSYLNDLKISRAEKLLSGSLYTVTEIAYSVGYPDVMAFSKFFKKSTGLSPSEYRARQNGE